MTARVEFDGLDGGLVAGIAAPALRMPRPGDLVHGRGVGENGDVSAVCGSLLEIVAWNFRLILCMLIHDRRSWILYRDDTLSERRNLSHRLTASS